MRVSIEVQIASLVFILAAAGGATPRQEARTQPLEPDESLWIMTEVRRQPLEPERIGEPRRIPFVVPGVSDWMNTGDAWVAKGKTSTEAIVGTDRLIVEEYYISSERTNEGPNRIYCAIARPELASNPVPVVLIFHGGGGHASPALALAAARRHPGMAGLAMDYNGQFAPGGGPHVTQWQNVSREQNLNLVPDLRNWRMYHYVIAARRTIDFLETLPWADAHRVGCVGVSYGGWVALILAGVDERVRCVTTGVSAGGVGEIPSKAAQPMRWDPPEQRALWLANYEPLAHAPKTQAGVFLQLASNDYWFWITGAARQLAALPGPKGWVIRPNSNHGAGGPEISDLAAPAFMRHVLLGAPGLPAVTHLASSEQGERFTWRISGPRPVTRTALYWSPGNAGSSARYWIELPAALVGDFWEARVPPDLASLAAQAFVNVLTDDGLAVTSALVVRTGIDPLTTPVAGWADDMLWDRARGAAAWRTPGSWYPQTEVAVNPEGLSLRPTGANREFCALTNSALLASGRAAQHPGLRLQIDGRGQAGTLKVTLTRDTMNLDERAYVAEIAYAAGAGEYPLAWSAFKLATKNVTAPPMPCPFDGLMLSGARADGTPLIVAKITF
jgi:dienelactone hydrolase